MRKYWFGQNDPTTPIRLSERVRESIQKLLY